MQGRLPLLYIKFIIYNYPLLFTALSRLTYASVKKYLAAFRNNGWKDEKMTASFPSDESDMITATNCHILDVCMARDMLILMRANPPLPFASK